MRRFVYPLASLLNAKRLLEKEAKRNLALAEQELQVQRQALAALEQAFAAASEQRRQQVLAGVAALALLQYDGHFASLRSRIDEQCQRVRQAEQARDRCQEALRLLYGEIRALELLREQQWTEHLQASELERALEVDEFVAFHQHRALGQGGAS